MQRFVLHLTDEQHEVLLRLTKDESNLALRALSEVCNLLLEPGNWRPVDPPVHGSEIMHPEFWDGVVGLDEGGD